VLTRDHTYSRQELGISDALGFADYLLCGLFVLFLMLACLPFAPLMIRRDMALERMLAARGRSALGQILCDLFAYCGGLTVMVAAIAALGKALAGDAMDVELLPGIPVILMVCSFSFLLYPVLRSHRRRAGAVFCHIGPVLCIRLHVPGVFLPC